MVEIQQSAEPRPTLDGAGSAVVVARRGTWPDEATADPLVVTARQIMVEEGPDQVPQVPFAEDDEMFETLRPDGPHEPLGVRVHDRRRLRTIRS